KSENARLRREVREWQAVASQSVANERQVAELKRLLHFEEGPTFPQDYRSVNTTVISFPNGPFAQEVTIEAGSSSGIRFGTPVVTADGLIGHVTNVSPHTATVTLLTDPTSAGTARDVAAAVHGLSRHGQVSTLILDHAGAQRQALSRPRPARDSSRHRAVRRHQRQRVLPHRARNAVRALRVPRCG